MASPRARTVASTAAAGGYTVVIAVITSIGVGDVAAAIFLGGVLAGGLSLAGQHAKRLLKRQADRAADGGGAAGSSPMSANAAREQWTIASAESPSVKSKSKSTARTVTRRLRPCW